ncbi:unnamed protein product [Lupinus luteus]|uniref:RRM domain-containing protein n=1 Tax=Lupinus luteus TaxID=3873 RepID=A0AAV1WNZ7_LUPLU
MDSESKQRVLRPHAKESKFSLRPHANLKFSSFSSPRLPSSSSAPFSLHGTVREKHNGAPGSFHGDFSSFYIANFPDDVSSKDLWNLFQKWGRVRDVYIPRKRNKLNQRFAFIRFDRVKNERRLALELDKVWIGNFKIFANIPLFNRNQSAPSVRRVVTPSWPKLDRIKLSDSRSFLDVVKGTDGVVGIPGLNSVDPSSVKDSGSFSYSAEKVDLEWLQNCMVGKTVETVDARLVSGLLKNEGFLTVVAHPIGGDLVLISPSEGEDLNEVLKDAKDWISAIFVSFQPWSKELLAGYRDVWLHCSGIPLHAWNEKFFVQLAKVFGSLRSVDEASRLKLSFENCRLLVRTQRNSHINQSVVVMIDGQNFLIHVWEVPGWEEQRKDLCKLGCRGHPSGAGAGLEGDDWSVDTDSWLSDKMAGAGILGRFGEDEDRVVEEREDVEREELERRCSTSLIDNNSPVRFSHEAPFIGINDECGADLNNGITGINDECVPVLNNGNNLALIEESENVENPLNVLEYVVKDGGTCAYEGNNESFSNSIIDGGPELNEKEHGLHGVVAPSILAAPLFQNNLDSLEFIAQVNPCSISNANICVTAPALVDDVPPFSSSGAAREENELVVYNNSHSMVSHDGEEGTQTLCMESNYKVCDVAQRENFISSLVSGPDEVENGGMCLAKKGRKMKLCKKDKKKSELLKWHDFCIDLRDIPTLSNPGVTSSHPPLADSVSGCDSGEAGDHQNDKFPCRLENSLENGPCSSVSRIAMSGKRGDSEELWEIGKSLGVSAFGNEAEIVEKLLVMENRDRDLCDGVRRSVDNINVNCLN